MSSQHELSEFPGMTTVSENGEDDLFITSASFEYRSVSGVDALSPGYRAKQGIIYVNRELLADSSENKTRENLDRIEEQLEEHCSTVSIAKGSWLNQEEQLNAMKEVLEGSVKNAANPTSVTLDCTTFNREALMMMLSLLYNRYPMTNTQVSYISPEHHGEWLSRGHNQIRNILGFTGLHKSQKPTVLILLTGFESHRANKIVKEFEPSQLLLGLGDPPTKEEFLKRNSEERKKIERHQDSKTFEFPANDIGGAYEVIDDLITSYSPDNNIVIAPMSTKLSTIGAWRAAREHQDVQVTYSIPGEYNKQGYSQGDDQIYIDNLPLNSESEPSDS